MNPSPCFDNGDGNGDGGDGDGDRDGDGDVQACRALMKEQGLRHLGKSSYAAPFKYFSLCISSSIS